MFIGKKIKELRKQRNIKLSEMAEKTGIQIATLSRIENHKMVGTLESHMKIAEALSIDITELYNDIIREDSAIEFKKPETDADVFVHSDESSYEIMVNKVLTKKMMPILIKIQPNGQTNQEQSPLGSERFVYVLEGSVDVVIESETFTLPQGASLYFRASSRHYFVNKGTSLGLVLSVLTPVTL